MDVEQQAGGESADDSLAGFRDPLGVVMGRVAVRSDEAPPELPAEAALGVEVPPGQREVLRWLVP